MTESEAIVTGLDGDYVWLELRSNCSSCESSRGCGIGDGQGRGRQRVRNTVGARVGDTVVVSAPDGTVMIAVLYSYLLPVALALAGAAGGTAVSGDPGAVAGAFLGLAAGWSWLKAAGRREPMLTLRLKHAVVQLHRESLS